MEFESKGVMEAAAGLEMNPLIKAMVAKLRTQYRVECVGADGKVKWVEYFENLVVDVGLDDVLDKYFKGSGYTATHYVGLKDTGSVIAGDTMGSHAGWGTITPYSDANDPTFTPGSVSSQSVDNSASKASFACNATDEVFGAFLKTDNTKGGTAGILYGGGDFASSRNVVNGDTLNVTITCTQA